MGRNEDDVVKKFEHIRRHMIKEDDEFKQVVNNKYDIHKTLYDIFLQEGEEVLALFYAYCKLNQDIINKEEDYLYKQAIEDGSNLMRLIWNYN